jgi:P27 family predicted phage terminase small subunit
MAGRPPKPLEQRRRTGRSPGRDSGGRPLPNVASVTALPGVIGPDGTLAIPRTPDDLLTGQRARTCPFRDRAVLTPADTQGCEVCLSEHGREAWERLWTAGQAWLSPSTDWDIMLNLCQLADEEAHHRAVLAEDGHYVKGQRGGLVAHPAHRMLRSCVAEGTRLAGLCGFTPSDRGRLGVGEVKRGTSALQQLLERRAGGGA